MVLGWVVMVFGLGACMAVRMGSIGMDIEGGGSGFCIPDSF